MYGEHAVNCLSKGLAPRVFGQNPAPSPSSVLSAWEIGLAEDEPEKIHSMNDVAHDTAR
jgi:hypothetical protein